MLELSHLLNCISDANADHTILNEPKITVKVNCIGIQLNAL